MKNTYGATSLTSMCEAMGISLTGRLHSGLDDSVTISTVLKGILTSGVALPPPEDWHASLAVFRNGPSKTVRQPFSFFRKSPKSAIFNSI